MYPLRRSLLSCMNKVLDPRGSLGRVTRNCQPVPFCASYKETGRTVEEVKKDIDSMTREYEGYPVRTVFLQDGDTLYKRFR